jgi:hypothetical protein
VSHKIKWQEAVHVRVSQGDLRHSCIKIAWDLDKNNSCQASLGPESGLHMGSWNNSNVPRGQGTSQLPGCSPQDVQAERQGQGTRCSGAERPPTCLPLRLKDSCVFCGPRCLGARGPSSTLWPCSSRKEHTKTVVGTGLAPSTPDLPNVSAAAPCPQEVAGADTPEQLQRRGGNGAQDHLEVSRTQETFM